MNTAPRALAYIIKLFTAIINLWMHLASVFVFVQNFLFTLTNTPASDETVLIMTVKRFMIQAPGPIVVKQFTYVIYEFF
jgi:hypothetical protein